jgi:hypothetical protein
MTVSRRNADILKRLASGEEAGAIAQHYHLSRNRIYQIRDGKRGGRVVEPTTTPKPKPKPHHAHGNQNGQKAAPKAHTRQTYSIEDVTTANLWGQVSVLLTAASRSAGVPERTLADRLRELLRDREGR